MVLSRNLFYKLVSSVKLAALQHHPEIIAQTLESNSLMETANKYNLQHFQTTICKYVYGHLLLELTPIELDTSLRLIHVAICNRDKKSLRTF